MTIRHWLLFSFAFAACGDDSNHRAIVDGPPGSPDDAAIDAPPSQAGAVKVKLTDSTSNVAVYFQKADGTLISKKLTDTNGEATETLDPGGTATVVRASVPPAAAPGGVFTNYSLFTWTGVKPGDVLLSAPPAGEGSGVGSATMTLTIPTVTNGVTYLVEGACGGEGQVVVMTTNAIVFAVATQTVTFTDYCAKDDLMILVKDIDGNLISSTVVEDVTIADMTTADLSAATYTDAVGRTIEVDHNTASTISGSTTVTSPKGQLFYNSYNLELVDPATYTETIPTPPANGRVVVGLDQSVNFQERYFVTWGAAADVTVDWTADVAPEFDVAPTFDTGTNTASWTALAGGAAVDAYAFQEDAYRGTASYAFTWKAVGKGDGTYSVKLPTLPTDIADFSITTDDSIAFAGMASYPGGYDALRQVVGVDSTVPPATATGKLSVTTYFGNRTVARSRTKLHNNARRH
ncbi:MAG: hypothetical protein QM831_10535 [Kofleriaceae bacterium]